MTLFDSSPVRGFRARTAIATMAAAVCLALTLAPATAQDKADASKSRAITSLAISNDKPIQIESNSLKISDRNKIATFDGNVKAVQDQTTLKANQMVVHYATDGGDIANGNSKIQRIDVTGQVFVQAGDQQATAETGVYDLASQTITLSGKKVVLNQGQNVFVGCRLTVRVETSEAKLDSCGKRVMIQLDPKSGDTAKK